MVLRNVSSRRMWHKSTTWSQMGWSSWSCACCVVALKWGLQLENVIAAASEDSSACVRACILPSTELKVISKRLWVFKVRRTSEGCRVSRAQAVRALSPGCLPWILPNRETTAFSAQVDLREFRSSSGTLIIILRSGSWFGLMLISAMLLCWVGVLVWGSVWIFCGSSWMIELLAWEELLSYLRDWSALVDCSCATAVLTYSIFLQSCVLVVPRVSNDSLCLLHSHNRYVGPWIFTIYLGDRILPKAGKSGSSPCFTELQHDALTPRHEP